MAVLLDNDFFALLNQRKHREKVNLEILGASRGHILTISWLETDKKSSFNDPN